MGGFIDDSKQKPTLEEQKATLLKLFEKAVSTQFQNEPPEIAVRIGYMALGLVHGVLQNPSNISEVHDSGISTGSLAAYTAGVATSKAAVYEFEKIALEMLHRCSTNPSEQPKASPKPPTSPFNPPRQKN